MKHRSRRAVQLSVTRDPRSRGRSLSLGYALVVLLAFLIVIALIRLFLVTAHRT